MLGKTIKKFQPTYDKDFGGSNETSEEIWGGLENDEEEEGDNEEIEDNKEVEEGGEETEEKLLDENDNEPQKKEDEIIESENKNTKSDVDSAFAAIRRENERLKEERDLLASNVYGQTNPITGEPIKTAEDLKAFENAREKQALEGIGLPGDYIQKQIENNPLLKEARIIIEKQNEAIQTASFNRELENIKKMNPDIKKLSDLQSIPEYDVFESLVKGGKHIDEAYKIIAKFKDTSKAAPVNKGKEHLISSKGNSGSAEQIPRETYELYKSLNPKATIKEIRAHWSKSHRREE